MSITVAGQPSIGRLCRLGLWQGSMLDQNPLLLSGRLRCRDLEFTGVSKANFPLHS